MRNPASFLAIGVLLGLLQSTTAIAQPIHQELQTGEKSAATALALSLAGASLGWGLAYWYDGDSELMDGVAISGLLFGPSLGHFYSGEIRDGAIHSGVRALGLSIAFAGGVAGAADCALNEALEDDEPCGEDSGMLHLGLVVAGLATVHSIITSGMSADRASEKARRRLQITPLPLKSVSTASRPGWSLGVQGHF